MNNRIALFCGGTVLVIAAFATGETFGQCNRGGGGGGGQRGGSMSGMTGMPTQMAMSNQLPYQNSGMGYQLANYANNAYQQMQQVALRQQLQQAYLQQMLRQQALDRATAAAERRETTRQKRIAAANARRALKANKQDEEFRRSQNSLATSK